MPKEGEMSSIENNTSRSSIFPGDRSGLKTRTPPSIGENGLKRNSNERKEELDGLSREDVKVTIPDSVKDFSRIKKMVDAAPDIDNSQKISDLRRSINDGTYKVDYEAVADKILSSEF
jgi:negative regulator of flagellin synthesis FlgM